MSGNGGIVAGRSGATFVKSFFRDRELNHKRHLKLDNLEGFWKLLLEEHQRSGDAKSRLASATAGYPLFFRGQSNESHGISTSLYRFIQSETKDEITEPLMAKVEAAILSDARARGLGKGMSDGHLLMLLQHYGSPTRLLDVSTGPMEALFFATEGNDAYDGRMFIFKVNNERNEWVIDRDLATDPLPWTSPGDNGRKTRSDWTEEVSLLAPLPIDPRMGAQESRFLIGGLIRASADRNIHFDGHNNFLDRYELPQITTLSVAFLKGPTKLSKTPWHALGWTIRIPAQWKPKLRQRLADIHISRDSMYPPFATVQWGSAQAGRQALSNP
ncbi:FRG domain-containing protein [Arthrobacter sp. NPDC057013]|uniref:FRG domain-containing protein n=1 Tax=Arthrobacter sp. NPDC057013 TaxID=3345999 RepID=UPI00363AFF71